MRILQKNPRLVFELDGIVYKELETKQDAIEEFKILDKYKGNLNYQNSLNTKFQLHLIEPISVKETKILMKKAPGKRLDIIFKEKKSYIEDIANLLSNYHKENSMDPLKIKILGDFVATNLFVSKKNKIVTYIDPGKSFKTKASFYLDISRFLYSVVQSLRFRIFKSMRIILKFIKTYKKNNDLSDKFLKEALIERFNISIQKFSKEKTFFGKYKSILFLIYAKRLILLTLYISKENND